MVKTAKQFIEEAKKLHGDKYDYSKIEYVNTDTKVCIICPIHGEFWQTPHNHLHGQKCPKCALLDRTNKRKKSKEQFIEDAQKIYGDKYNYYKVEYKNNKTKVCVICPIHGEFWVRPDMHLHGLGCPNCGSEKRIKTLRDKRGLTIDEFIKRAISIHGNKYNYSKVKYVNIETKVCIICPIHGEFWQTPWTHLNGEGCPNCSLEKRKKSIKTKLGLTKNDFIEKSNEVHGNRYNYSKVEYVNANTKVCIICPIHGEFWQRPSQHLQGCGCPACNESKLEREIRLMLSENGIDFISSCGMDIFPWLKKQHLDFYLPQYNTAIECQGEQHFTSVEHFGGESNLKDVIARDLKKQKLCIEHGIRLLYYTNYLCEESKNMIFNKLEILNKL